MLRAPLPPCFLELLSHSGPSLHPYIKSTLSQGDCSWHLHLHQDLTAIPLLPYVSIIHCVTRVYLRLYFRVANVIPIPIRLQNYTVIVRPKLLLLQHSPLQRTLQATMLAVLRGHGVTC